MMVNDPSVTELWLGYSGRMKRRHLEQVVRALQSATHIVELKFSFSLFRGVFRKIGDLESVKGAAIRAPFVEWIGTSSSLLKLEFQGTSCRREVETHLLSCFIPAISSRAAKGRDPLKSLSLAWVGVNANDVVTLVRDASLQVFHMSDSQILKGSFCTVEESVQQVAQSFAINSSILDLSLDHSDDNETYCCAILNALQSNSLVETLSIHKRKTDTISALVTHAIVDLLESTGCPIGNLGFEGFNWNDDRFGEIAHAVCASPRRIKSLKIQDCCFHLPAHAGLRSIFSQSSHTVELRLSERVVFSGADDYSVLTEIIGSSPGLHHLCMSDCDDFENWNDIAKAVLRGLGSDICSVKRLELDSFPDEQYPALVKAIKSFRQVEYLSFDFHVERLKGKLMAAFWHNRTLLEATVLGDCLDASDRARILAFHQRNRDLCTLIRVQANATKSGDSHGLRQIFLPSLFFISIDATTGVGQRNIFEGLLRSGDSIGPVTSSFSAKRSRPT
jgi:hypothetical protein